MNAEVQALAVDFRAWLEEQVACSMPEGTYRRAYESALRKYDELRTLAQPAAAGEAVAWLTEVWMQEIGGSGGYWMEEVLPHREEGEGFRNARPLYTHPLPASAGDAVSEAEIALGYLEAAGYCTSEEVAHALEVAGNPAHPLHPLPASAGDAWIPVGERLPPENADLLLALEPDRNDEERDDPWAVIGGYEGGQFTRYGVPLRANVTHWKGIRMPDAATTGADAKEET